LARRGRERETAALKFVLSRAEGDRKSSARMEPSRSGAAQASRVVPSHPTPRPAASRSTSNERQEDRMRSYRPYSRAASIIHFTQSGSARGGSSHEVESTKRER